MLSKNFPGSYLYVRRESFIHQQSSKKQSTATVISSPDKKKKKNTARKGKINHTIEYCLLSETPSCPKSLRPVAYTHPSSARVRQYCEPLHGHYEDSSRVIRLITNFKHRHIVSSNPIAQ